MIADLEHHLYLSGEVHKGTSKSGRIVERHPGADGRVRSVPYEAASDVQRHLQFMDQAGIDVAVLTTNAMSTLDQCRRWHDFCARVVNEHPKRFVGFASLPPLGGEEALRELDRAVRQLGLKGVHIRTRSEGRMLDSRELWPFYEKVSELGIPIDVHVSGYPTGMDAIYADYALHYVIARELDMCAATFRVCLGGVLEDFPDLKFIMNHFGGGISAIMERVDVYAGYAGPSFPDFYSGKPLISRPWREYFDKLYFNMAGREVGMAAVKCALTTISPRKLMFATDWPFNYDGNPDGVKRYAEGIRKLDIPADDAEAMLGGNAAELLGIKIS